MKRYKMTKNKRKSRKNAGFTLVEVLVALLIMSIGLSAIAVSVVTSLRISNHSKERSQVLAFARLKLEELHTVGFDNSSLDVGVHNFATNELYAGRYVVENTSPTMRRVTITVSWDEAFSRARNGGNAPQTVQLDSTISKALH